ncbi:MAG: sterol desaturase family protein [Planctomycetota bacterium]|nr:sterol desaturase family protein [Planctomycetota bacterium]
MALFAGPPWSPSQLPPHPLQIILVIVLADLAQYWGHRLAHQVPLLWRFHGVHHTSTSLDWLAAYREHPIDGLYSQLLLMGPAAFLGVHPITIMPVLVFRGLWAVLVHCNVRLPLGPLGILLGDPVLHRWHHAKRVTEHNYANLAPYLDVLFGTHHRPEKEDYRLGVEGDFPRTFSAQLIPGWQRAMEALRRVFTVDCSSIPEAQSGSDTLNSESPAGARPEMRIGGSTLE